MASATKMHKAMEAFIVECLSKEKEENGGRD